MTVKEQLLLELSRCQIRLGRVKASGVRLVVLNDVLQRLDNLVALVKPVDGRVLGSGHSENRK